MSDTVKNIIMAIVFILSVVLIFVGQKNIGYMGLLIEIIGLAGIVGVLFTYNKKYKIKEYR